MGACTSAKSKDFGEKVDQEFLSVKEKCKNFVIAVSESELRSLSMIYQDLASRYEKNTLNMENFQLFFHKNGFWGERLFR